MKQSDNIFCDFTKKDNFWLKISSKFFNLCKLIFEFQYTLLFYQIMELYHWLFEDARETKQMLTGGTSKKNNKKGTVVIW